MILVTGATGNVGGALVSRLSRAGARVRALVRHAERADSLRGFDVDCVLGRYEDADSLRRAVTGVDRVFLLSAVNARMAEQELAVVRAVQQAAPQAHVVKLAVAGVNAADADGGQVDGAPSRVLEAHRSVVRALADAGVATTVLAPTMFMQNLLSQAGAVRSGALYAPAGDAALAHVDARDVAAVAAHVLTSDGHAGATYTITGPEALTYEQVAGLLSELTGREVRYVDVSPEQAREQLVGGGLEQWLADGLVELNARYRSGRSDPLTDEVRKATGTPARSLRQFLTEHRSVFA